MVKVIIVVLVLAGGALLVAYYAGGIGSFDPTEQGREAKAAISLGMSWTKVIDVAGEPQHYRIFRKVSKKGPGGQDVETIKPGGELKFDRPLVQQDITNKQMPDGFIFEYFFSQQVAFQVWFDGTGLVTAVENVQTMADLLQTRDGG